MPNKFLNTQDSAAPQRLRDNVGKIKVSESQNLFEADFEYSGQPMRWENYTVGAATITQVSNQGGVQLSVTAASGDLAIRQTRPYIRYQPGKTIYMATGHLFGPAYTNNRQRVGFFDDANGMFLEVGDPTATNPTGLAAVYRSDTGTNGVQEYRTLAVNWSDPNQVAASINWNIIQMVWMEYAWYGAGMLRWGVTIGGEPYTLHQVGIANLPSQIVAWSRTGNLPVRYENRNVGATTANSFYHWGVSVLAEGKIDTQRGFTYGYGTAPTRAPASATRYPLLSIRYRNMGTLEYGVDTAYSGSNGTLPTGGAAITGVSQTTTQTIVTCSSATWTPSQWVNKYFFSRAATQGLTSIVASTGSAVVVTTGTNFMLNGRYVTISGATGNTTVNGVFLVSAASPFVFTITGAGITTGAVTGTPVMTSGQGPIGRIIANTANTLTVVDNISSTTTTTLPMLIPPSNGGNYIIGVIDRGQILPQTLSIYSSANCTLELISSTYSSPVQLTGASFATAYSLGSLNSFAERDISATALVGGEVVYNTPLPAGGLQTFDLTPFFPLYNIVQGNQPDILTVAITGTATVGASIIAQEAMS
jgi:hypothetical protein